MKPWLAGLAGATLAATAWMGTQRWQGARARRRLAAVVHGDVRREWFEGFEQVVVLAPGDELRFGSDADPSLYLVVGGRLRLTESGRTIGPGSLVTRADVAVAPAEARLLALAASELLNVYARYPEFGAFLLRLLTERLFERLELGDNVARFEDYTRSRSG